MDIPSLLNKSDAGIKLSSEEIRFLMLQALDLLEDIKAEIVRSIELAEAKK